MRKRIKQWLFNRLILPLFKELISPIQVYSEVTVLTKPMTAENRKLAFDLIERALVLDVAKALLDEGLVAVESKTKGTHTQIITTVKAVIRVYRPL